LYRALIDPLQPMLNRVAVLFEIKQPSRQLFRTPGSGRAWREDRSRTLYISPPGAIFV
jgi:hypothetical protein